MKLVFMGAPLVKAEAKSKKRFGGKDTPLGSPKAVTGKAQVGIFTANELLRHTGNLHYFKIGLAGCLGRPQ
jgi:hypothetical protein